MKKVLLLLVAIIALGWQGTAQAQEIADHAIGIRIGADSDGIGPEANYQHRLSDKNRLEVGLAYHGDSYTNTTKLTGVYQWVWAIENGFNWYAGPGAGLGIASYKYKYYPYKNNKSEMFGFVTGAIGIEYQFDFPLLLSFDFRPQFNFGYVDDVSYDFGLGARYVF